MKKRIDLVFCSVNRGKANMDFESFLLALVKIADFKFPHVEPAQGLKAMLDFHLIPLS